VRRTTGALYESDGAASSSARRATSAADSLMAAPGASARSATARCDTLRPTTPPTNASSMRASVNWPKLSSAAACVAYARARRRRPLSNGASVDSREILPGVPARP